MVSLKARWNRISWDYQRRSKIGTEDIHYGEFIYSERELQLLGDVKGGRVLEIGCGGGQNSIVLAKKGAVVSGIDFSKNQIAYAKRLAKKEGMKVDFHVGDMQNLSRFPDCTFDLVMTAFSLLYVESLQKTFAEVHRVLKDEGVFVFSEGHPCAEGKLVQYEGENVYAIRDYFKRRKIYWEDKLPDGTRVKMFSYHRPLQDYFEALLKEGFTVLRYLEPERLPKSRLLRKERESIEKICEARDDYASMGLVPFVFIIKAVKRSYSKCARGIFQK